MFEIVISFYGYLSSFQNALPTLRKDLNEQEIHFSLYNCARQLSDQTVPFRNAFGWMVGLGSFWAPLADEN